MHNRLIATATAEPSGATYSFRDIQVHNFNTPSGPAPNGSIIDKEVGHLVSHGSGSDELVSFTQHLVFTGRGEMKVVVDKFRSVCH